MDSSKPRNIKLRINIGVGLTIIGFLVFILGADPGIFSLDPRPVVGFVQTATFSTGLAMICLGGFIGLKACQRAEGLQTLAQDIGVRLVATGYLIALVSSMADVFGFGTQAYPALPFFGPMQAAGVMIGEIIIAVGFLLYLPLPSSRPKA